MRSMTSLERVLSTIGHNEPDRVPFFLLLTMHGAKELGMTIKEYFSKGENVAEGQLRLREKYGHDCLYPFFYASIEVEAWGSEVLYTDNGPPNGGEPLIKKPEDIIGLKAPAVKGNKPLGKVLKAIELLNKNGNEVPIIGVVMSPFSLPVMQLGFEGYLLLMHNYPDLFERLMKINEEFVVSWANAQLEAGATAITYFDPVSSTTIIPKELFLRTGYKIAKRTISRIKGPTAYHVASGRSLPIINEIAQVGSPILGASVQEDLSDLKLACKNKLTILGNLNGIEMCRWTQKETEDTVKKAIDMAAQGGGFILSDNHGEIPFQVKDETLHSIAETVRSYGRYPIIRK